MFEKASLNPSKYTMYGPYISGGEKTVQEILKEGDLYVYIIQDEQYTKIVKAPPNGDPQDGYYYVGTISEYGSKKLIPMEAGKYRVRG